LFGRHVVLDAIRILASADAPEEALLSLTGLNLAKLAKSRWKDHKIEAVRSSQAQINMLQFCSAKAAAMLLGVPANCSFGMPNVMAAETLEEPRGRSAHGTAMTAF
jgi:predicted outer membrane lipoprotein